jgi:hypothetical protein
VTPADDELIAAVGAALLKALGSGAQTVVVPAHLFRNASAEAQDAARKMCLGKRLILQDAGGKRRVLKDPSITGCWFCKSAPPSAEAAILIEATKEAKGGPGSVSTLSKKASVEVPRCSACLQLHQRAWRPVAVVNGCSVLVALLALGMGIARSAAINGPGEQIPIAIGLGLAVLIVIVGALLGLLVAQLYCRHHGSRWEFYKDKHPRVRKLWKWQRQPWDREWA